MTVETFDIDSVVIGNRHRAPNAERVKALADSIAEIGLQTPITVWLEHETDFSDCTPHLVAGLHRLEACKSLGLAEIECTITTADELDRELWEIDENLCRADLTELERANHTERRGAIVREKAEWELRLDSSHNSKDGPKNRGQVQFVKDTAKATGRSVASVKKDKARGEKIAPDVKKEIEGTPVADSGVQLDALAKATPDQQREAVKAVSLGNAKDVREVLGPDPDHVQKQYEAVKNAYLRASAESRELFREWLAGAGI
jgi:hypothetical protein